MPAKETTAIAISKYSSHIFDKVVVYHYHGLIPDIVQKLALVNSTSDDVKGGDNGLRTLANKCIIVGVMPTSMVWQRSGMESMSEIEVSHR